MKKEITRYSFDQCALYKCKSKKRLEELLQLEAGAIKRIDEIIGYKKFTTQKKDGSLRELSAPCEDLKNVQRRILKLFAHVKRPDWLISGEKGKCYLDNAKVHQESRYMLAIDIKKFYDNCKRDRVYRFLRDKLKTSPDVADILATIMSYNGIIPTGCPTSQMISYYAYEDMFTRINNIAAENGCVFTLYVDDMTISSRTHFCKEKVLKQVDIELRKYGHKPKYKKVHYYSQKCFKPVTGVIITKNNMLAVPNNLRRKILNDLALLKAHQVSFFKSKDRKGVNELALKSLRGKLIAAQSIEKHIFPEVKKYVDNKFSIIHVEKKEHKRRQQKLNPARSRANPA